MERDDVIEYSLDAHHSEEEGKKIRKKIWFVTFLLSAITIAEVLVGVMWPKNALGADSGAWLSIKIFYIVLTLVKAGYIVLVFMHLGDERKSLKYVILVPYIIFIIYAMFILFVEGNALNIIWTS
jgi:caa(3)-type oxidase subunit IV